MTFNSLAAELIYGATSTELTKSVFLHFYIFGGFWNVWFFVETKTPKILTKQPPVATTVTNITIGTLAYPDIPSDLWSRPEQSHHLPWALLPWWLQLANIVSNGRHHLQLCWMALRFIIYDHIFRLRQKFTIFDEIYPFNCGINLSGAIEQMHQAEKLAYCSRRVRKLLIVLKKERLYTLDFKTAYVIATSIVYYRLDYCNSLHYSLSQTSLHRIQSIQNALDRAIAHTPLHRPITPTKITTWAECWTAYPI